MTDEESVALIAAQAQGHMNHLLGGSRDGRSMNENRTDWRRFLRPGQRPPQQQGYPQQPPQNYDPRFDPRNYTQPGQQPPQRGQDFPPMDDDLRNFGDISIPSEVPSGIRQLPLPPLPKDENGNVIIPPELQGYFTNQPAAQPSQELGLNTSGFSIPNYSNPNSPVGISQTKAEEKFDLIIKEIKLLKRAVNTLTNLVKKSKLIDDNEPVSVTATSNDDSKGENIN